MDTRSLEPENSAEKTSRSNDHVPLRWLSSCPQLFELQDSDRKDIICAIECTKDRIIQADTVLSEIEKIMMNQVHTWISSQATYFEALFNEEARMIDRVRQSELDILAIEKELDSSHTMALSLFQAITGIIEAGPMDSESSQTQNNSESN